MSIIFPKQRPARMGNRKPLTTGRGLTPLEFKQRQRTKRGYVLNHKTGLRLYA